MEELMCHMLSEWVQIMDDQCSERTIDQYVKQWIRRKVLDWMNISDGRSAVGSYKLHIILSYVNSYSASHDNWCTVTLWNRIMTAQCEGMGEVGSARYEPALLPPCPSIRVLSYSNCQRSTHSSRRAWQCKCYHCISAFVIPVGTIWSSPQGHVSALWSAHSHIRFLLSLIHQVHQ